MRATSFSATTVVCYPLYVDYYYDYFKNTIN